MPAPSRRTIFISHSSVDAQVTKELYHSLTGHFRLDCWMDNFDLHTIGSPFSAQIVDALRSSGLLVLVNSPAARASDYVTRELQAARDMQMPIQRCSINDQQPVILRKIKILWLAFIIQVRLARGFLLAAFTLTLVLAAMLFIIFILGARVVPAMARVWPDLPAAFQPTSTATALAAPSDPKLAAPFHFKPDTVILGDDFNASGSGTSLNDQILTYSPDPRIPNVKISQQNGSLEMFFPAECLDGKLVNDCQVGLVSKVLDAKAIEYFGLRARTGSRTYLRGVSISLSVYIPSSNGNGFGWYFTDRAMAFFHSILALPEKNMYTYVPIDLGWHAYEILRDPLKSMYYYYIDGQLVSTYLPDHASEWNQAPLQMTIYSIGNKLTDPTGKAVIDTQFDIDELVVGGFTSR